MTDSTASATSLRVCFGALVDLVKASRDPNPATYEIADVENIADIETAISWARAQEESSANARAVSAIVAGGYQVGIYKAVFFWLQDKLVTDATDAAIVWDLIAAFGNNPPCRITPADAN